MKLYCFSSSIKTSAPGRVRNSYKVSSIDI
jgi:hypothetical protein